MKKEIQMANKELCGWYLRNSNNCKILCELQCDLRGKCTFCESKKSIIERNAPYIEAMKKYEEIFKKIKKSKKWSNERLKEEFNSFLKSTTQEKEEYLSLLEL